MIGWLYLAALFAAAVAIFVLACRWYERMYGWPKETGVVVPTLARSPRGGSGTSGPRRERGGAGRGRCRPARTRPPALHR